MKSVYVVAIGIAGFSAMLAIAAHGRILGAVSNTEPKAEAVADANGNLHVPNSYRTRYQLLGGWAVAADEGHGAYLRQLSKR